MALTYFENIEAKHTHNSSNKEKVCKNLSQNYFLQLLDHQVFKCPNVLYTEGRGYSVPLLEPGGTGHIS